MIGIKIRIPSHFQSLAAEEVSAHPCAVVTSSTSRLTHVHSFHRSRTASDAVRLVPRFHPTIRLPGGISRRGRQTSCEAHRSTVQQMLLRREKGGGGRSTEVL